MTSAGNSLPFRVPRRCTRVVGNGTAAEGSPFDPCDFNVTGGGAGSLYLGECAAGVGPTEAAPCEPKQRSLGENCTDEGPFECREAGCPKHTPGWVDCAFLAKEKMCALPWGEVYDERIPFPLNANTPIGKNCPLSCTPRLCLNSKYYTDLKAEMKALHEAETANKTPEEKAKLAAAQERAASQRNNEASQRSTQNSLEASRTGLERGEGGGGGGGGGGGERVPVAGDAEEELAEPEKGGGAPPSKEDPGAREMACRVRMQQFGAMSVSSRRVHGLSDAALGFEWCPQRVTSSVSLEPEMVAEVCRLEPWWGRDYFTETLASRASARWQWAVAVVAQLLFGLHGIFAYLAPSLVGTAVGAHLAHEGRVSKEFLTSSALGCSAALAAGLAILFQLRTKVTPDGAAFAQVAQDSFLRSGSPSRLLWGAADTAIILWLLATVETSAARRAAWERSTRASAASGRCRSPCTRCTRRLKRWWRRRSSSPPRTAGGRSPAPTPTCRSASSRRRRWCGMRATGRRSSPGGRTAACGRGAAAPRATPPTSRRS